MSLDLEIKKELSEGLSDVKSQIQEKSKDVDERIKNISASMERGEKERAEDKEEFQKSVESLTKLEKSFDIFSEKLKGFNSGGIEKAKTIGQIAGECEALKSYSGGNMVLANVDASVAKMLTSDSGAVLQSQSLGIRNGAEEAFKLRTLLPVLGTTSASIDFAVPTFVNNAAAQDGDGATKAQSDMTFVKKTSNVVTIAHWLPISKQLMADAVGLTNFIDFKLRMGLGKAEDNQILLGDGTSGNFTGIVPQASAFTAASGDQQLDSVRKMILKVILDSDSSADGIVLNPQDWADIELLKTDDKAYLFSNPQNGTEPRLWGKRVVESKGMTAGSALVGSFLFGATLWDREQVTVRASEHHANFFVENMVALLCEERLALTVETPNAFTSGALLA